MSSISRAPSTPPFAEYVNGFVLVPFKAPPNSRLFDLLGPNPSWLEIPSFQRGISWDIENVKELLFSTSMLLGNAILAQLPVVASAVPGFLPIGQKNVHVLVDGLQRFAVGTALLSALHDDVLAPHPNRISEVSAFTPLAARVASFDAVYKHNDLELANHPRQAVRDQYLVLRDSIKQYCLEEFNSGRGAQLARAVAPLFIARQLALDVYHNFNRSEILATFIGINTVRVDLGPVDLLRAAIVERATDSGWLQADLEAIENDFTDTLTADQKPKQGILPFVNAVLKVIDGGRGARLFPSWSGLFVKDDVDTFLGFIDRLEAAFLNNPYLREIEACGKLPVSTVLAHYYMDLIHGSKSEPAFFTSGSGPSGADAELNLYLVSCYRLLLDGSIGKTGDFLHRLVDGSAPMSLAQLADAVSNQFLATSISAQLDQHWLDAQLSRVDKKRAPRVFNAMLLPPRTAHGTAFTPLRFGRSARSFHVDHLIPESMSSVIAPGASETQTLRNLAPLPANNNRVAKATSCYHKLAASGIYDQYVRTPGPVHPVHPYCAWLVTNAADPTRATYLDLQANLEKGSTPDLGTERLAHIRDELLSRI